VESIAQSLTYEMDRPAAGWDSLRVSIEESQSVSGLLFSLRSHAFPEGEGTDCISLRLNALSAELAP
jgi:hypothetical protein